MDTKKSIDWKKEIPRIIQLDGTVIYDCDIFGGDNVNFEAIECLFISGNISVGNRFSAVNIWAENIFFGDFAVVGNLIPSVGVFLGDNADVANIDADGDVSFGDNADTGDIYTCGNVSFGDNANVACIDADGDISFGDNANTGDIYTCGNVSFGDNSLTGKVISEIGSNN